MNEYFKYYPTTEIGNGNAKEMVKIISTYYHNYMAYSFQPLM